MLGVAQKTANLLRPRHVARIPDDLTLVDNGAAFADKQNALEHLWFRQVVREAGVAREVFRVVPLRVLRYLPQEARQEAGLSNKMQAALVGLYNQRTANYDLVEMKAFVADPPLGLVQMYGVVGMGATLEAAKRNATLGLAALEGVMSNFPQARLAPPTVEITEWVREALKSFDYTLVGIGHPQEREGPRGMGREGPGEMPTALTHIVEQQGEMFCRGMAQVQEEFLSVTLASRISMAALVDMLDATAQEAAKVASLQTGSDSAHFSMAIPFAFSQSTATNASAAYGQSEAQGTSDGVASSQSESHVTSESNTVGRAVTDGTADTSGVATSSGGSSSYGVSISESTGHVDGTATSTGTARTVGRATSTGTAHTHGSFSSSGVSSGGSWGVSYGQSGGQALGASHTDSAGTAHGVSSGSAQGVTTGTTQSTSTGGGSATSQGTTVTDGTSATTTLGGAVTMGGSVGGSVGGSGTIGEGVVPAGVTGDVSVSGSLSTSATVSASQASGSQHSEAQTATQTSSSNWGASTGTSTGTSSVSSQGVSDVASQGTADTASVVDSTGWSATQSFGGFSSVSSSAGSSSSTTTSHGVTESEATTESEGSSISAADSVGRTVTTSASHSSFASTTHSSSHTVSHAETNSWARTTGTARGTSTGTTRSHGVSRSVGSTVGRSLGVSRGLGFSAAAVPAFGISRSIQWWNDAAVQLAQVLRTQEELLRVATLEGGWMTDYYILARTERGAAAVEALFRQAYGGQARLTVTPPRTRRLSEDEQKYIRFHALNFTPSTREEQSREALETYQDTTILVPGQLAAYVSPLAFEEGMSITTQERIPPFAFDPSMEGDVVLGHQWSTERAVLTRVPLRLSRARHMHTLFSADTRFGKSVAAERLALETTKAWKTRTVVFDFGMGWRRMIKAPIPQGRVEVFQLYPNAPVPLCFNPWQVPRRIEATQLLTANCELFKNAGRMGPKQLGYMRRTAEAMYQDAGVLTASDAVLGSKTWGKVRDGDEEYVVNLARQERGLKPERQVRKALADLAPFERHALAIHRSKAVGMAEWVERLRQRQLDLEKKKQAVNAQSVEGVVLRLEAFTQGEMARMYGKGGSVVTVEDFGLLGPPDDVWGMTVVEGGAELDEYAKVALMGLLAWRLYTDSMVRRRENIGLSQRSQLLQIVLEEANKVLTGIGEDEGEGPATTTSELYLRMFRDGAKYLTYYYVIAQSISELPPAIISSCANAWFSQMKNPKDRDLGVAHLAYSEKGFTDEDYKRFISRIAQAMMVCKLGLSQDVTHTTPFLVRPVMVPGLEPTDREVLEHHLKLNEQRLKWREQARMGGMVA